MAGNPYTRAISVLVEKTYPKVPRWTCSALVIFTALRIIMMLCCIIILCIPIFKGKTSRQKHLWIIRRKYLYPGSLTPYLVPNRSLLVALCELVSSACYITLATLNYKRFKSVETAEHTVVIAWYGVSWLPTYLGIWLAGWGLLYACFGPGAGTSSQTVRFLKPRLHNALWIGWSVVIAATTIFWAALCHLEVQGLYRNVGKLISLLKIAESAWSANPNDQVNIPLTEITAHKRMIIEGRKQIAKYTRGWSLSWIMFELILAAFYIFLVQHLLRMIRRILQFCESQALYCGNVQAVSSPWCSDTQNQFKKTSVDLTELRDEFRFLALYNFIIGLVLLCEIMVAMFQVKVSSHLQEPMWIAFAAVNCMGPSTLMSPALLYQCWRIFTERNADESNFDTPTKSTQQTNEPIFQEQLLKWYVGPQQDKADLLNLDNFPGITEGFQQPAPTRNSLSWKRSPPIHKLDFRITREVTTTNC